MYFDVWQQQSAAAETLMGAEDVIVTNVKKMKLKLSHLFYCLAQRQIRILHCHLFKDFYWELNH